MKKQSLLVASCLMMGAAAAFTSCSNDDVIVNSDFDQSIASAQVLTLQVASAGDGMTTRAGRPLLSSAADQKIDQVALYFVQTSEGANKGKLVLKKWVNWTTAADYDDGKQLEIALKSENNQKLLAGTYMVYAVGYSGQKDADTDFTFTPGAMFSDDGNVIGADNWGNFQATLKNDEKYAEEVFAGMTTVTVNDKGAFDLQKDGKKNHIVLHRQVAGATGYFNNIPVSVDGKPSRYVRLVASAKNKTVLFDNFNGGFTSNPNHNEFNKPGDANEAGFKYIVNGTDAVQTANAKFANGSSAFVVYKIDLQDWFAKDPNEETNYKGYDVNGDGFLGTDDVKKYLEDNKIEEKDLNSPSQYAKVWKNPNAKHGQSVYRGTVFGAEFVIPIAYVDGQNTLQLQVTDEAGNVLKYWNINVKEDQLHKQQPATQAAAEQKFDFSKSIFNLYRNHMYSVGMKAENTVPGEPTPDPEKPKPDPVIPEKPEVLPDGEKPADLSKGQDLIIYVNDNWEVIHDMEID